jgi:hypothetical protein
VPKGTLRSGSRNTPVLLAAQRNLRHAQGCNPLIISFLYQYLNLRWRRMGFL